MQEVEVSISSLRLKESTRLQCMAGCLHYRRNPLCPLACPDIKWFKRFIESYQKAKILYETTKFIDTFDSIVKKNLFHTKLLKLEHRLKREGKYYTLCFVSGACTFCGENCNLDECNRRLVGRVPVCATGIDIMHLTNQILGLSKEIGLSFWKPNLSPAYFDKADNRHLYLGIIFC